MPSERILFTFPGKIGDTLLEWPFARQWAEENETQIEVGLDQGCASLVDLLALQPCVKQVHLLEGITNYDVGGQPWDFGWGEDRKEWDRVFHLGFRTFPNAGAMRETYHLVPLRASFEEIAAKPAISPAWTGPNGALPVVLHGTKGRPNFYKALIQCFPLIGKTFSPIVWAGRPDEWPGDAGFEGDGLPLTEVAERISVSALVFAASSSVAALAGVMGAPCIRIGEPMLHPHEVWDNPGPRQYSVKPDRNAKKMLEQVIEEQPWQIHSVA